MLRLIFINIFLALSISRILIFELVSLSLIFVSPFLLHFFRIYSVSSLYTCFEKDNIPVNTEEIFEGHCNDIHGNKYQKDSTTTSCCDCLVYVLSVTAHALTRFLVTASQLL